MSVLHIDSSARKSASISRQLSAYLVSELAKTTHYRDLAFDPLPPISAQDLVAVHGSHVDGSDSFRQQLALSDALIDELRQADTVVFGVALYNFSVPAVLKQWIDAVCRAGVSFKYTEQGPQGLLGIKNAYIVTASGGTPIGSELDFASPYLAAICRFLGVENVHHIDANGSKREPALNIVQGKKQIDNVLRLAG